MDSKALLEDLHFQLSNPSSTHVSESKETVDQISSGFSQLQLDVEDRLAMTEKWVAYVHLRNRKRSLSTDSYFGTDSVCAKLKKSFLKPLRVTEEDLEDLRLRLAQIKIDDIDVGSKQGCEGNGPGIEGEDNIYFPSSNGGVPRTQRFRSKTVPVFQFIKTPDSESSTHTLLNPKSEHPTCNLASVQSVDLIKDILFDENRNQIRAYLPCSPGKHTKVLCGSEEIKFQNFRSVSVFPSSRELKQTNSTINIRPNRIVGSYENGEDYLETQFYLLREDFMKPLKEGIADYKKQLRKGTIPNEVKNLKLHHNVQIIEPRFKEDKIGIVIDMGFPLSEKIGDKDFMDGSLVLITPNHFKDIFVGTVISRRFIQRSVDSCQERPLRNSRVKSNLLMVQLNDASHFDQALKRRRILLAESQAFFQPYYYVMKIFQGLYDDDLPLKECIIYSSKSDAASSPPYLLQNTEYLLEDNFKVSVMSGTTWPDAEVLCVNDSQLKALKKALSQKLVVIQGPPGTGKTYLGCKVAKALLQNKQSWNPEGNRPMLLMCQTNHALDQFMELLLPVSKKIIRIGCQSKSDILEPFNIREWMRRCRPTISTQSDVKKHKIELKKLALNVQACHVELMRVSSHGVLDFQTLVNMGVIEFSHSECFINSQSFLIWLEEYKKCQVLNKCNCHDANGREYQTPQCKRHMLTGTYPQEENESKGSGDAHFLWNSGNGSNATKNIHIKYILSLPDLEFALKEQKRNKLLVDEPSPDTILLREMEERLKFFQKCISVKNENHSQSFSGSCLWTVPPCIRWVLYRSWIKKLEGVIQSHLELLETNYLSASSALADLKQQQKLEAMRKADLVGMTTSAAARLYPVLRELQCPIALVEEAAEVHESHIVATITKHCQHLILLGDHKQLRPRPACYSLSRTHFTDVSLFERLLLNSTVTVNTLLTQHRMQPEISALIRPSVYPELYDHECTRNRENILGMKKNVYFFSHQWQECRNLLTGSYSNHQEANMSVQLLRYLLKENYSVNEICILTAYREQVIVIEECCKLYPELSQVRVLTVDNFQGEECKIVILSLVRNNTDNQIGFLKIENRVCVALSRARDGLYILGNIELLSHNSELWLSVQKTLLSSAAVGWSLPLSCRRHPLEPKSVWQPEELAKYIDSGGCRLPCLFKLACGHICRRKCHENDTLHLKYRCEQPCKKKCPSGHKCQKKCFKECGNCENIVWKRLACGHNAQTKCCLKSSNYLCEITVEKRMEPCSHRVNLQCWMPPVSQKYCPNQCPVLLKCGHRCLLRCNSLKHPNHREMNCSKCVKKYGEYHSNHDLITH